MYEQLGFEWLSPLAASAVLGVLLGVVFGAVAFKTRFCLRRALVSDNTSERSSAAGIWLTALGVAIVGTQLSVLAGWIDFSAHRFHGAELPYALIVLGGLLFGAGMVLTRGCASRLTVLAGSGNIRAMIVLLIFAITAHATLKGILSPLRTGLAEFTVNTGALHTWIQSPAGASILVAALVAAIAMVVIKSNADRTQLVAGAVIGALVPLGWVGTGLVLQDEFDPIVFQSLSFTSSSSEWLFWSIASTSIGAGFGVGLMFGVVLGSAVSAIVSHEFKWVSFSSPAQTGRYSLGAVMMGVGGVFAGGCTVGAGLSGIASLSVSAILTLASIVAGALVLNAILGKTASDVALNARAASLPG